MKKLLLLPGFLVIIFCVLWFNIDINSERVTTIYGSPALYDINGKLFHVRLSPNSEWQIPIPLEEMGKWLPIVAVNAEDGRFYRHCGIDFLAMARAFYQNIIHAKIVSGASTITSQTVRLAVSERENRKRNFATKIREFIMAVKLENQIPKSKILECYLNLAPFGGNIRGVQAASLIYFGKSASQISRGEACLLIGMLKAPTLYRPDTKPMAALKRRNDVINLMERKNVFTSEEAKRAYLEILPKHKFDMPSRAYHYAELVLNPNPNANEEAVNTTLNLEIQTKLEGILRQSLNDFPDDVTIAAGIVDNKNAALTAWVGNARFSYTNWVDCGRSPRSPGSTLKPFAYLMAIEDGDLTASTLLADSSMAFSGRAPRNFDLKYHGAVTARVALSESLNAPAVRVLRSVGTDRVLSFMRSVGLRHLTQSAGFYGDSLILGGCDVTVLEELEAFTGIASFGIHRPIKFLQDTTSFYTRFASPEGCYIISDILRYNGELSLFARGTLGKQWRMALKTGTSYGLRDAWAAAWTPDYTVVVWAGRPDGTSWEGLIGARAAAPVAVKILRVVSPKSSWYDRPDNLILRNVCTLSGKPPTALCPATKLDFAIENVTKTIPCDIHKFVSGKGVINHLPPEFLPNMPGLPNLPKLSDFKIVSPISGAGVKYFTAPFDFQRKIPMKAEGAVNNVSWFLDGVYIGSSKPDKTFFHPVPDGLHVISASDETGRSTFIRINVITPAKIPAPTLKLN